jgi:hypothetical protein
MPKTLTREEWIKAGIIAAKELQRREDAKSAVPKGKKKKAEKADAKPGEKPKKELKKASGLKGAKKNAEEKMSH